MHAPARLAVAKRGPVTFLFAPGSEPAKAAKAIASTAPAVILDLEASVLEAGKEQARANVRDLIRAHEKEQARLWVRINPAGPAFERDVEAIPWPSVAGAMLAQAEDPSRLQTLAGAGASRLIPLVESAAAFAGLAALAAVPGVERFAIGTWDLLLDLGILTVSDPDESELIWQLRGQLVVASRQAGLQPPIDGVCARLDDDELFRQSCRRAQQLGFGGKLLVHPRQIALAAEVFGPDEERLQLAREMIDAYERAVKEGLGVVRVHGRMVDKPMIEQARALLARWTTC